MTRILFICHGNICRSAMAEMVMKHMAKEAGRENDFHIESAGTSAEELGNDIYPPAKNCLRFHNVSFTHRAARQVVRNDYDNFDLLLCADQRNIRNLRYNLGSDILECDAERENPKIKLMMSLTRGKGENLEVADPWYTDDFEATYSDVTEVCRHLLEKY